MSRTEDQELQRFLDHDHPVRDAYRRMPQDEPPAALDAAILDAAREEARRPVRPRWLIPLSVAATVALGVGLSTRLISVPMQSISDVSDENLTSGVYVDAPASSAALRDAAQAEPRAPASRPSVDALITPEIIGNTHVQKATVDAAELRQRALAQTRTFTPPTLEAPQVEAPAADDMTSREQAFAAAPPVAADSEQVRVRPGSDADALARLQHHVMAKRTVQSVSRRPMEAMAAQEPARVDRSGADTRRATADAALAEIMSGFADDAPADEPPLADDATTRQLQATVLREIRLLLEDGRDAEAQAIFDQLLEITPQVELPDDFPLERAPPVP